MKLLKLTKNLYAQVDDEDYLRVSAFKWHASAQGREQDRFYACRFHTVNGKRTKVWLHRFIMGLPDSLVGIDPLVVDHDDGDGLNCTRDNLKIVTWSQNLEFVNNKIRRKREREIPCL